MKRKSFSLYFFIFLMISNAPGQQKVIKSINYIETCVESQDFGLYSFTDNNLNKDPDVSLIKLEIRREMRVVLVFEGFRKIPKGRLYNRPESGREINLFAI